MYSVTSPAPTMYYLLTAWRAVVNEWVPSAQLCSALLCSALLCSLCWLLCCGLARLATNATARTQIWLGVRVASTSAILVQCLLLKGAERHKSPSHSLFLTLVFLQCCFLTSPECLRRLCLLVALRSRSGQWKGMSMSSHYGVLHHPGVADGDEGNSYLVMQQQYNNVRFCIEMSPSFGAYITHTHAHVNLI